VQYLGKNLLSYSRLTQNQNGYIRGRHLLCDVQGMVEGRRVAYDAEPLFEGL
jgi:hypothetical protein